MTRTTRGAHDALHALEKWRADNGRKYALVRSAFDAGATVSDIARALGMTRDTVYGWLKRTEPPETAAGLSEDDRTALAESALLPADPEQGRVYATPSGRVMVYCGEHTGWRQAVFVQTPRRG